MNDSQYLAHAARPRMQSYNAQKQHNAYQQFVDASAQKIAAEKHLQNSDEFVQRMQELQDAAQKDIYAAGRGLKREQAAQRSYEYRNRSHKPEMLFGKPTSRIVRKR